MFCPTERLPDLEVTTMRTKMFLAVVAAGLLATSAAFAGNGPAKLRYSFLGQLTATPANGGVSITVQGGNKAALRAMLGQPVTQTFAYGANTEFLKWAAGVPTIVQAGDLVAGDYVWVHVRAKRGATLAELEQQQAGLVGDHGATLNTPDKPLWLFRGTLTSATSTAVTLHVIGGDRRAMKLLIGQSADQTFTVGGETIFLLWQGKVPTVIDASKLVVGDKIIVRIRADKGSTLAQLEATAANHVGDREPAAK
jgi:hypothetical protein